TQLHSRVDERRSYIRNSRGAWRAFYKVLFESRAHLRHSSSGGHPVPAFTALQEVAIVKTALIVVAAVAAIALSTPASAQWLNQPTAALPRTADGKPDLTAPTPRAADGKPDLSGLWLKISPKYSRNIAADLKRDEVQPWARALVEERRENLGKDYMNVKCVPLGPGYATAADSTGAEMMRIVQTPGLILILNPDLTYRQV